MKRGPCFDGGLSLLQSAVGPGLKENFFLRFPIYEGTRREYLAGRTAMMSIEKFREYVRTRNLKILERSRRGDSRKTLAQRFALSRCSIDAILHRFEAEQRLSDRSNRLLEAIRQADDLDRLWPVEDLIDAIRPLPMTRSYLKKHFAEQRISDLSLRALMEMAIPMAPGPEPAPALRRLLLEVYGVGKKGFWSVVNRLTSLDLGAQFKRE